MANMVFGKTIRKIFGEKSGSAAVEFAIGAPILFGGLVIMTDLGLAFFDQMNLDQAVKAGAEFVMADVDDTNEIEELVASAAVGYDSSGGDSSSIPSVATTTTCNCPGSTASVSCTSICTSSDSLPNKFYDINASKTYDAIFLPDLTLRSKIRVQVR